jgi:hypothetical protein
MRSFIKALAKEPVAFVIDILTLLKTLRSGFMTGWDKKQRFQIF